MKFLKALCASCVAAVIFSALGVTSASAGVLCATTSNPCNNRYGGNTVIDTDINGTTTLSMGVGNVTCNGGTLQFTVTNAGNVATSVQASFAKAKMTWAGCNAVTLQGGELEFHHIAGTENATATAKNFQVTAEVLGVSCVYGPGAAKDIGTLTGGASPTLNINVNLPKQAGGGLCANPGGWTATYEVTSPTPIYSEPS